MNAPKDLRTFIKNLESANELVRVKCEVDPYLEVAAIVDKVCKSPGGGKALLFENVKGSSLPIAANLFGSMRRMAMCFGADSIETLANRVKQELAEYNETTSFEALRQMVKKSVDRNVPDTTISRKSNLVTCHLGELPALHSWPGDGGRYLTLAQVFTSKPSSKKQNCGMYRIQVVNDDRALLRCHTGSGCEQHLKAWYQLDQPMPVAIALGGPPALTWAAGVSLPDDMEETDFIAWLTGKPVPMETCSFSELKVPKTSEIVIEGLIYPNDMMIEGPFGNHTGYYSDRSLAPVIRIKSVKSGAHSKSVYPCTVVGPPPMENVSMARVSEVLMMLFLQHDCPWLEDLHMPEETIYHRIAFVQVKQECDLSVQEIESELTHSMCFVSTKKIILMDNHINIRSLKEVYWSFVNNADTSEMSGPVLVDARSRNNKHCVLPKGDVVSLVKKRWQEYGL